LNGLNVWNGLGWLMAPPEPKKRKIGFLVEERAARYGKRQLEIHPERFEPFDPAQGKRPTAV
jgi:hypothetical protein